MRRGPTDRHRWGWCVLVLSPVGRPRETRPYRLTTGVIPSPSSPLSPCGRVPGVRGLVLPLSFPTFQTLSFPTFQTLSFPTLLIGNPRPGVRGLYPRDVLPTTATPAESRHCARWPARVALPVPPQRSRPGTHSTPSGSPGGSGKSRGRPEPSRHTGSAPAPPPEPSRSLRPPGPAGEGLQNGFPLTDGGNDRGRGGHDRGRDGNDRGRGGNDRGRDGHDRGRDRYDRGRDGHDRGRDGHDRGRDGHDRGRGRHDAGRAPSPPLPPSPLAGEGQG